MNPPTMPCPDCGQEVVQAHFRDDVAFVEAAEEGPLRLRLAYRDRCLVGVYASPVGPYRYGDRCRLHRCSRRVEEPACEHDFESFSSYDPPGVTVYLCRKGCGYGWKVT
jgi:hypothetical protein